MTTLPYDPEHPSREPPAGADPVLWMMAYRIHTEHRPGPDGFCVAATCRATSNRWPCPPFEIARAGFLEACRPIMDRRRGGRGPR